MFCHTGMSSKYLNQKYPYRYNYVNDFCLEIRLSSELQFIEQHGRQLGSAKVLILSEVRYLKGRTKTLEHLE